MFFRTQKLEAVTSMVMAIITHFQEQSVRILVGVTSKRVTKSMLLPLSMMPLARLRMKQVILAIT